MRMDTKQSVQNAYTKASAAKVRCCLLRGHRVSWKQPVDENDVLLIRRYQVPPDICTLAWKVA